MKKEYINPEMEIIELNCQNELLSMSGHNRDTSEGNDDIY